MNGNPSKITVLTGAFVALSPAVMLAVDAPPKSGTTSYTTHFVFVPKSTVAVPGVGKAVVFKAAGTTENTAGEKFLDKMKVKCVAVSVDAGDKKWIDGACALIDADGDIIFSTFDTRDLDKSQPKIDCGTHIVTGGTGKYKGITGMEAFACINKEAPVGSPEGALAMDIPHISTWEIK